MEQKKKPLESRLKIPRAYKYSLSESNRILTIQQGDSPRMNIEKRILS